MFSLISYKEDKTKKNKYQLSDGTEIQTKDPELYIQKALEEQTG